jgi:hypothetical protein
LGAYCKLKPGGPNKGSATQYFLGEFNGNKFIASDTTTSGWIMGLMNMQA